MLIVFFRSMILYLLILIVMRLMGKRQIGELQPGEFAITMMISNMAVLPIEDANIPMLIGIAPIITLTCFEILAANISMKSKTIRKILSGNPVVVIENGQIKQKALHALRYTIDDLTEGLRGKNIFNIEEVEYAVVETDGTLNVLQKYQSQSVTPKVLGIDGKAKTPPVIVVSDGKLLEENVIKVKSTDNWIINEILKRGLKLKEVFLMTVDTDKKVFIVRKED